MKKSKIAASTLIVLLAFSSVSLAGERQGAEVVVTKKDRTQVSGELIAVKKSSLLLLADRPVAGTDLAVALDEINVVKIGKKSKFASGLGYGVLIGGGSGALLGLASGDDPPGWFSYTASEKAIMGAIVLGVLGMTLGGIAGGLSGMDESISIGEKTEPALQAVLQKLAKHARVKEIQ
jgi:hypothetical protein